MNFCTKCGTQLFDGAVICHNCGNPVAAPTATQPQPQPQQTAIPAAPQPQMIVVDPAVVRAKKLNALEIINFIYALAAVASSFLIVLALTFLEVRGDFFSSTIGPNLVLTIFAMIFALGMSALSIVGIAFTVSLKLDRKALFASIVRVSLAGLTFLATFLSLVAV